MYVRCTYLNEFGIFQKTKNLNVKTERIGFDLFQTCKIMNRVTTYAPAAAAAAAIVATN